MPLGTQPKPSPWNISRQFLSTQWQPFWDKIISAYPFWDNTSADVKDVKAGKHGTITGAFKTTDIYGPTLDFGNVSSNHVSVQSVDPPTRGAAVFLAKTRLNNILQTLYYGSSSYEIRYSGGGRILHQIFRSSLTGTSYSYPQNSYTMSGFCWDGTTGGGELRENGSLVQTTTGHTNDPNILSTVYIGSNGSSNGFDGVVDMILLLSDWPSQTEWDMLAADPFGWSRPVSQGETANVSCVGAVGI